MNEEQKQLGLKDILAKVAETPNLRFDPATISAYQGLGGALTNGGIPGPNVQAIPIGIASSQSGIKAINDIKEKIDQKITTLNQPSPKTEPIKTEPSVESILIDEGKTPQQLAGEKALKETENYYTETIARQNDFLEKMKLSVDETTKPVITALQLQFEQRKKELLDLNKRSFAIVQTAQIRSGGAKYTPEHSRAIITEEEETGIQRLNALENSYLQAVAQVQASVADKKWTIMAEQFDRVEKLESQRRKELNDLSEKMRERNEKIVIERQQENKDSFISGLILGKGITDPIELMSLSKNSGLGITFKDINAITSTIKTADKTIPGVFGEWLSVRKQVPGLENITLDEYISVVHPEQVLDYQMKTLQIAKLQKDLEEKDIPEDPMNILAYAQQYASTGAIPSGLPKGTFGIVAQTAKVLPKQKGEIVDSKTGIKSSGVSDALQGGYGNLSSTIDLSKQLKEFDKARWGGIVSGIFGKLFGTDVQQKYVDLRSQIVDLLARARTGAALTTNEEEFYSSLLPGRFDEPFGFGANSQIRIQNFIDGLSTDLTNKINAQGLSIYGFSKVKIGDREYTVGDTITNSQGQVGRVLPDGSIYLIE